MKLTKSQLRQIIKEELKTVLEGGYAGHYEPDHPGATEESQDLVVTANERLVDAKSALYDLYDAVTEEGFAFTRDSSVTLADLDYKMKQLNRYWEMLWKTQN